MSVSSRPILRFLLSEFDYARVDLTTLAVSEVTTWPTPLKFLAPPPGSLRVRFRLTDPAGAAPQVVPLFPGALTYRRNYDDLTSIVLPTAADFPGNGHGSFQQWPVRGIIRVTTERTLEHLSALFAGWSGFAPVPNTAWYYPVHLTDSFLGTTIARDQLTGSLRTALDPLPVLAQNACELIPVDDPEWWKNALAGFFRGEYQPELTIGTSPPDDAVERCEMPRFVKGPDEYFELFVSFAYRPRVSNSSLTTVGHLHDGPVASLDEVTDAVFREFPIHVINGALPAWYLYSRAVGQYVGTMHDSMVATFATKLGHRRYFPVRFTRTWLPVENASQYFPTTQLNVAVGAQPAEEQRIPVHGVLFLTDTAPHSDPVPTANFDVDKTQLRILAVSQVVNDVPMVDVNGVSVPAWRAHEPVLPASATRSALLAIPLSIDVPIHLLCRRPMSEALFADIEGYIAAVGCNGWTNLPSEYKASGKYCTYFSLHRVLRALIDNQIVGGRLNYPPLVLEQNAVRDQSQAQHQPDIERANRDLIARAYSANGQAHGTVHALVRLFENHGPDRRASMEVVRVWLFRDDGHLTTRRWRREVLGALVAGGCACA